MLKAIFVRDAAVSALAAILLGGVCLAFTNFAMQWQPVPEPAASMTILVWLSSATLIASGALLLTSRTTRLGGWAVAAVFALWVVLLHLPRIATDPASVVNWLGAAEIGSLALGGALWAVSGKSNYARLSRLFVGLFGVCVLVFGISHFVYAEFTAMMVPTWIPGRLSWAYITGACHCAAGLALIVGVNPRLAAGLLALMCGAFALLVQFPGVISDTRSQAQWTGLAISILIAGSAWIVRSVAETPPLAPKAPQGHLSS